MNKGQNTENKDKALHIGGIIWRKFLPFIPILGIPLTVIYHNEFGDTGLESNSINFITAIIQAISISAVLIYGI